MGGVRTPTRRQVLATFGATAATALLPAMTGAARADAPAAWAGPRLPRAVGDGKTVLILGAGIAGLTAAYELGKAGYDCRIFEAQGRAGGRSFTARRGDVVVEEGADGTRTTQRCDFDEGLYLNLGPGRLPYHHRRVLSYCRELGVALEPYIKETTANLFQSDDGFGAAAQVNRRIANDTRGHLAALLSKALDRGALDDDLDTAQRKDLADLLDTFGDLDDGTYHGSTRCGYAQPLSVHQKRQAAGPLAVGELLDSGFWRHSVYQPVDFLWQHTMFQPVGGMDRIVAGFTRRIGDRITYNAEVTAVRTRPDGVTVTVRTDGRTSTVEGDYCLSNIPLPVLQRIDTNFSDSFADAVDHARFTPSCKVGWQANRRFWEDDPYQIYGGISWIDHVISQVWYPSNDYFTAKGTMTGAYNTRDKALALGDLSHAERLTTARDGARRLHPEFDDDAIVPQRLGMSIAWHKVPLQLGGWASWRDDAEDREAYGRLLSPDGRFHVIGDQVSPLPGWQEGAMISAEYVIRQVTGVESTAVPRVHSAPDSIALTEGRI